MTATRDHGQGEIEPRPGKRGTKYRARYRHAGKKVTLGTFASEAAAELAISEFVASLSQHAPLVGDTVATWGETWLNAREVDGVHRSVKKDRHCFKRVTRSTLADLPLAAVTPRDVRQWVADQVKAKPGRQTVCNALNLLRVCLEAACDARHIDTNPAAGVKVPKLARTKEPWTWLRPAELDKLLKEDSEERDIYACAIYMGVRAGELFGLEWTDVDLVHGVATIRYSWQGKPTKPGAVRTLTLIEPAIEALKRQRKRSAKRRNVFPARDGEARTEDQMPDLSAALVRAGIKRHVRFHDLRHTCASALIQGTWSPHWVMRPLRLEEVSKWLGHGSITATQRYAHLCPEAVSGLVVRPAPSVAPNGPKSEKLTRGRKRVSA